MDTPQGVIASCRDACPACPYFAVCPVGPVFLEAEARPGERRRHPQGKTLGAFLERLRTVSSRWERDVLQAMADPDEGKALVAGCLLAEGLFDEPDRMHRLLEGLATRAGHAASAAAPGDVVRGGPGKRLEDQLLRASAFLQDPSAAPYLGAPFRLARPDREVTAYEAVRLTTRLLAGDLSPAEWWASAVHPDDRPAFEASFMLRDVPGEGRGLDLFFSARAGGRSSVFYLRRDAEGKQAVVPIEGVRPDSLLKRVFKVFEGDARKCHRLFAKICRHFNNDFKRIDKRSLWEGLKQLPRDDMVSLSIYAPKLAKYIEKRADFVGLYRLVKFLHRTRAHGEDETATTAHANVYLHRESFLGVFEHVGKERFKDLCRAIFRMAETYRPHPAMADIIFKVGEVAYFLTALMGLNARGLEVSLEGTNAMAFIAYGLQPASERPELRYRRLMKARARVEAMPAGEAPGDGLTESGSDAGSGPDGTESPGSAGKASTRRDLLESIDLGLAYMAAMHGYESVEAFTTSMDARLAAQGIAAPGPGGAPNP